MRFRQIEVFHAVYTTGSISAAARTLHVSQPSVSKVLHHTQQQLGLELFRLVRGRLVATEEAHALFVEVSEVCNRLTSRQRTVGNLHNRASGRIRLAVVPSRSPTTKSACTRPGKSVAWLAEMAGMEWQLMWML